ncbi:MAG: hypothetical protein CME32_21525 [Gimesia sp.]|nr:hypothetical protein [Gimesia sp.]
MDSRGIHKLTSQTQSVQIKLPIIFIFGFISIMLTPLSKSWSQPWKNGHCRDQPILGKKEASNRTLPVSAGMAAPTLPRRVKYVMYSRAKVPREDDASIKSINDLPLEKRKQFDQAYLNWQSVPKYEREWEYKILEENQLLRTAVKKLNGELSTKESQIKQEIRKLWNLTLHFLPTNRSKKVVRNFLLDESSHLFITVVNQHHPLTESAYHVLANYIFHAACLLYHWTCH